MAAKKTQAARAEPAQPAEDHNKTFPHAVESPYLAGWEHALTKQYGARGNRWTSTKGEPQWTVRFKDDNAAAWFKSTWSAGGQSSESGE